LLRNEPGEFRFLSILGIMPRRQRVMRRRAGMHGSAGMIGPKVG
jgi:hypothetical protein